MIEYFVHNVYVFHFSTNANVLHEVTFGTHMEYPDGSVPSKSNLVMPIHYKY